MKRRSNRWANADNWTRDLFLTKETLYHWATSAKYIKFIEKRAGDGGRTRDIQLGRLMLYQLSYSRLLFWFFNVGRAGFEPAKVKTNRFTVCPRWPLEYLPKKNHYLKEPSRWRDSNPRPADYKSAALASWATSAYAKKKPAVKADSKCKYLFFQTKQNK